MKTQTASTLQVLTLFSGLGRLVDGDALSPVQRRLVAYLASHNGRFVADWELKDYLYGGVASADVIAVTVLRIRRRLGRSFIETGEEGGYRLSAQRSSEVLRVCGQCGRMIVRYHEEWVCYGCPSTQHVDLDVGRADGPGERSGKTWTQDEIHFALSHNADMSFEEMGAALGRSEASVRGLYQGRGVRKQYVRTAR